MPAEFTSEAQSFEIQHRFVVNPYMNPWHPLHLPPTDLTNYPTTVPPELRETYGNRRIAINSVAQDLIEIPALAPELRMQEFSDQAPPREIHLPSRRKIVWNLLKVISVKISKFLGT